MSAAGPVIGLDESDISELDAGVRLSAEMSSPRLLSRRTPVATVGVTTSVASKAGAGVRGGTGVNSRPSSAIRSARHSGGLGERGPPGSGSGSILAEKTTTTAGAAGVAHTHTHTPGVGAQPSPSTSPQRQRRRGGDGGGGQYKTHATAERFMPINFGSNQTSSSAHLSAIKANATFTATTTAGTSSTPFSAANRHLNVSSSFSRGPGGKPRQGCLLTHLYAQI